MAERTALSLSELNGLIKAAITGSLPDTYWVVAEIADIKQNQKGHCYLELVEKKEHTTVAQIRATIWVYEYRAISSRFLKATGEALRQGMKVLFLASVSYHEVYGLSLGIKDIDPTYTLGEMARKKKEVVERLRKEGLLDLNKARELPLLPRRIAVISSPTAAGYSDFFRHLDTNPYGYWFGHTLFPALMQGPEAEQSILSALLSIQKKSAAFDCVVIIRGGGSVIDLNCFDSYALAARVAAFPLPVITGIGHEKDDTVVDLVAHTRMKTPTAVAEFLISGTRCFEQRVLDLERRVIQQAGEMLQSNRLKLNSYAQKLLLVPVRLTPVFRNRLLTLQREIRALLKQRFQDETAGLNRMEQAVRHLDPANVLKRGYSITTCRGKLVRAASELRPGAAIETTLHKGTVTSIVRSNKEVQGHGKEQRTDLLPGFE
ncbi:MAG: exodeoxyribonuclease VII large subunit [Thermodesulfovibrionales bacterium]